MPEIDNGDPESAYWALYSILSDTTLVGIHIRGLSRLK